ncbi:ion channel protein, partial [Cystoisospora suis]
MSSDYATQEFFLSAATLEFLMTFLQQTDVIQMLLWPSFWIELFTLPPLMVLLYLGFDHIIAVHKSAAELLLLTGCLRWIKTFVMTRFISASVVWGNATKGHVVQLVLGIVFLLTSFASAMYTSDGINPIDIDTPNRKLFTAGEFFNFWYFGVVTMSTVGYGDISPHTVWGQAFCIIFIVTSLIWVPSEFGRLIESVTSRRKVWGRLPLRIDQTSFILLVGDVEPSQLSTFIQEVRLRRAVPPKVVVLCQRQFEDFRNQMEEAQSGQIRLCLVTGEAGIGGDPADLLSVQPNLSRGVFLLSSPAALTAYYDRQSLTRLLSLKRLKVDPSHISVQLCTDVCANIVASMGCLNYTILSDLKMGLLAKSLCGHSGIIPLICNLSGSLYPDVPLPQLDQKFGKHLTPYVAEYVRGAVHSLFAFTVPPCMVGVPFEEVCLGLYYCANIICVGIQRESFLSRYYYHRGLSSRNFDESSSPYGSFPSESFSCFDYFSSLKQHAGEQILRLFHRCCHRSCSCSSSSCCCCCMKKTPKNMTSYAPTTTTATKHAVSRSSPSLGAHQRGGSRRYSQPQHRCGSSSPSPSSSPSSPCRSLGVARRGHREEEEEWNPPSLDQGLRHSTGESFIENRGVPEKEDQHVNERGLSNGTRERNLSHKADVISVAPSKKKEGEKTTSPEILSSRVMLPPHTKTAERRYRSESKKTMKAKTSAPGLVVSFKDPIDENKIYSVGSTEEECDQKHQGSSSS